jgi:hypothetical protein
MQYSFGLTATPHHGDILLALQPRPIHGNIFFGLAAMPHCDNQFFFASRQESISFRLTAIHPSWRYRFLFTSR